MNKLSVFLLSIASAGIAQATVVYQTVQPDSPLADTAYHTWSQTPALFPPDRFHFDVLDVS